MPVAVHVSISTRLSCRRRAGLSVREKRRTTAWASGSRVDSTAGILAALIIAGAPAAGASDANSVSMNPGASMAISDSLHLVSHGLQLEATRQYAWQILLSASEGALTVGNLSNSLNPDSAAQMGVVQQSMQGAAADAASAAGIALRSAQEAEQSFETMLSDTSSKVPSYSDVQQALGSALSADLGPNATNVLLGLGVSILVLLGLIAFQFAQRQKSESALGAEIQSLEDMKTKLENRLNNLDQTKVSLEASLTSEKEKKLQAMKRGDALNEQLLATSKSLDSKSAQQELTAVALQDTQKELDKEQTAGTALGEQVIDLSRKVEQQTARALKAEDVSSQLHKEVARTEKELTAERKKASGLETRVARLEDTVQKMTDQAEQQATAAQELRESASEAKTAADAAYHRVSTQLQLSMDQAKSLKKSLAQTDGSLKKSQDAAAKLEEQVQRTRSKAEGLQMRLDTTASDLKKAHDVLEKQQSANSILKADNAAMQERIKKLSSTLEATTLRLSSEVDVASDMKSQLAELKLEYIAAGDKLEAEQTHIKELQVDLRNMESALNAVSHDKKAAIMENAQLAAQLEGSQKSLMAAEAAQRKAETELTNTQALAKHLQQQLAEFESDLQVMVETAQMKESELEKEQAERTAMEAQVDALKRQVVSIEQAERTAREQAQAAVVELRQEIEAARTRKRTMTKTSGSGAAGGKVPALAQQSSSSTESGAAVTDRKQSKSNETV